MTRPRVWNSDPWDITLQPLSVRGRAPDGSWLHGSEARIIPVTGVWLETRATLDSDWHLIDPYYTQVIALVKPGTYTIEFRGSRYGSAARQVDVRDALAGLASVERYGVTFAYRAGTWDEFVLRENAYAALDITDHDIVMDVGAHIGTFACAALAHNAHVVAYEPEPVNNHLLRANMGGRGEVVEACVVGDESESVELWIDAAGDGQLRRNALHSVKRSRGARVPRRVRAVNWQAELERVMPTVLKVDVEGAEADYDWTALPDSVRQVAVEIETVPELRSERLVRKALVDAGFKVVSDRGGWSTVVCAKRR